MIIQFSSESFLFKRKDHIAALLYTPFTFVEMIAVVAAAYVACFAA